MKKGEELKGTIESTVYNIGMLFLTLSIAFFISSLLVGIELPDIFRIFFSSSLASSTGFLQTLVRTTPILIATLGLIVAFKSGVWNIGGEGQIIIGVIVTTGICLFLPLPPLLAILLSFLISFLTGGAYGAFAGFLKAKWEVNEIAITMMQTFVASALLQYLIDGPWNWGVGLYPRTDLIPLDTRLPYIQYPLNVTFLIGVALVLAMHILLNRTVFGYELRAMGSNRMAAFNQGIATSRLMVLTMLISGGICGTAGTCLVLGEYFRAQGGISGNYGFYAIATALIAENKALGAPFSALLIAFIYQGTLGVTALGLPHRLSEAIIGIIFIVILLPRVIKKLGGA